MTAAGVVGHPQESAHREIDFSSDAEQIFGDDSGAVSMGGETASTER